MLSLIALFLCLAVIVHAMFSIQNLGEGVRVAMLRGLGDLARFTLRGLIWAVPMAFVIAIWVLVFVKISGWT